MSTDELIDVTQELSRNFPTANAEKIKNFGRSVADLDADMVRVAIHKQAVAGRKFFDLEILLKDATPAAPRQDFTEIALESKRKLAEAQRLHEQAKASMAIVDELSDDQAAELKQEVLAELPAAMAAAVLHSDPRVSPMLRGLIAAKLVPGKPTLESLPFVPPRPTPQKVSA